jgi:hypothetical protein
MSSEPLNKNHFLAQAATMRLLGAIYIVCGILIGLAVHSRLQAKNDPQLYSIPLSLFWSSILACIELQFCARKLRIAGERYIPEDEEDDDSEEEDNKPSDISMHHIYLTFIYVGAALGSSSLMRFSELWVCLALSLGVAYHVFKIWYDNKEAKSIAQDIELN